MAVQSQLLFNFGTKIQGNEMKLHEDSESVKQIFDHFRNVGIAALLLSSTGWTSRQILSPALFMQITYSIATLLLVMVGVGLFILNFRHGHFLLDKRLPRLSWKSLLIRLCYGLFIFIFFASLAIRVIDK